MELGEEIAVFSQLIEAIKRVPMCSFACLEKSFSQKARRQLCDTRVEKWPAYAYVHTCTYVVSASGASLGCGALRCAGGLARRLQSIAARLGLNFGQFCWKEGSRASETALSTMSVHVSVEYSYLDVATLLLRPGTNSAMTQRSARRRALIQWAETQTMTYGAQKAMGGGRHLALKYPREIQFIHSYHRQHCGLNTDVET
jgi:hypothetical protein